MPSAQAIRLYSRYCTRRSHPPCSMAPAALRWAFVACALALLTHGATAATPEAPTLVAASEREGAPPSISVNCTWLTPTAPVVMDMMNTNDRPVKILTCGANACAGSGSKARHYVDCPLPVPPHIETRLYLDQALHFMVFEYNATSQQECWPSKTGTFASSITVPMTDPKACAGP